MGGYGMRFWGGNPGHSSQVSAVIHLQA